MLINGEPYKVWKYKNELSKNLVIATLSEGAISLSDIDSMPLLDRNHFYKVLVDRYNQQQERLKQRQQHKQTNKSNRTNK